MKLESKIGEIIEGSGLRDDYLADKLGVSKRTIYNLKKGLSYPTFEKAFLLAKILRCRVDDLAILSEDEKDGSDNPNTLHDK